MEKTSSSVTYTHLLNKLDESLVEQKHRHLWLFLYSSRHTHLQLFEPHASKGLGLQESNQLIDDAVDLLEQYAPSKPWPFFPPRDILAAQLNQFCFGITYAFHRKHLADGFIDIRFEDQLPSYNAFIDRLNPDEIAVVSRLHDLTYKYGFLITELWYALIESKNLIDTFITENLKAENVGKISSFIFAKKGNHPNGIQISTKKYPATINESWDLAIFIKENENLSKIKEKVSNSWPGSENQIIGDPNNYVIALYVDRGKCKISNALTTLRLQINLLNDYVDGPVIIPHSEELANLEKNKAKSQKEMRKKLASTIDCIRLSEGLISKRWSVDKSNVRRSIGLYLWDKMNIVDYPRESRKQHITDLINKLKTEKPEILGLYLGKFNEYNTTEKTTKYGDSAKSLETVIREMEADYDLTARCIQKFEYLAPNDVKG